MCNIFILILHQFFKIFYINEMFQIIERLNKKTKIESVFVLVL